MKQKDHHSSDFTDLFFDATTGMQKIICYKLNQLRDRKWKFQGWISTQNTFKLTYNDQNTGEDYSIKGYFELADSFVIDQATFSFHVVDEKTDKSISFEIEFDDQKSLKEINEAVVNLLKCNRSHRYFLEDYNRYMSSGPFDYIEQLIRNRQIDFNILDKSNDDLQYRYCGEYGEDYVEIGIDDQDPFELDYEEEGDEPCDYLYVNVSDRFHFEYREENFDEKIRKLVQLLNPVTIAVEDVLVITSTLYCITQRHPLQRIKAFVYIDNGKNIEEIQAEALRCDTCNVFYIMEYEYQRVCKLGNICCHVITIKDYGKMLNRNYSWSPQSLLKSYGYNANAKEALSDYQRQRILSFIIENEIITIDRAAEYISWFIRSHPHNKDAILKWNRDLRYLRNYKPIAGIVRVRNIYRKDYIQ